MASISFKIEVDAVKLLADGLGSIDAVTLGAASLTAVNQVAEATYTKARAQMVRDISLTDEYLQKRMDFSAGTDPVRPRAVITANVALTNLISYSPGQLIQPTKWSNSPRTPRIGDKARGIPVNRKQAGLRVNVSRSHDAFVSYAFLITRKDNGVTFVGGRAKGDRTGKGKVRAKTGPSVYQLFKATLDDKFIDSVAFDLSNSVSTLTVEAILKAIK